MTLVVWIMIFKLLLVWTAAWVFLQRPPPGLAGSSLLASQLILGAAVELAGFITSLRGQYNLHLFDLAGPVEFLLLAGFGLAQFRTARIRRLGGMLALAVAAGVAAWDWPAMVADHLSASRAYLVHSLVLTGLFLAVLFRLALRSLRPLHRVPLFWLALGLVLFYGLELPFRGLYNYVVAHDLELARRLHHINDITYTLRYGLVLVACGVGARHISPPEPWTTSASPS